MRESVIEEAVVRIAEDNNWLFRKLRWIGRRGAPDRLFMRKGVALFVELKADGEEPTIQQKREHKRMRDHGMRVEIIDRIEQAHRIFK